MSIPTTRLGRTGLAVSRLALGTMTFGLQTEENVAREIMSKAASAGVNFIDTADVYPLGGSLATVGRTEEIVGRWLMGQRESYVLATKAVGRVGPSPWDQGASRKHLLDAIDASLRRLQTDYVDLYQLHSDDAATPLDETLEALDAIVKSGRARYVGLSNFLAYRVARALGRCDVKGLPRRLDSAALQPAVSANGTRIAAAGVGRGPGSHTYNPLAGGLLTENTGRVLRAAAGHALHPGNGRRHVPGSLLERALLRDRPNPGAPGGTRRERR